MTQEICIDYWKPSDKTASLGLISQRNLIGLKDVFYTEKTVYAKEGMESSICKGRDAIFLESVIDHTLNLENY